MFALTADGYYRSSRLDELKWLNHGFGTRVCPLSDVRPLRQLRQIHSNITLEAGPEPGLAGEADGLISRSAGLFLGVKTADCLPLLLVDPHERAIAAVHAGWRGTVAGIARQAVQHLQRCYGSDPRRMLAVIGPGIGFCCYEVGPEVAIQFRNLFPERHDLDRRTRLDLGAANCRLLEETGIPPGQIDSSGLCTACRPQEFHSYRRDREGAGRMFSVIAIRDTKGAGAIPRL